MICRVYDCKRQAKAAREMCWGHYQRWLRYGHPLGSSTRPRAVERLMERVSTPEVGCWLYDTNDLERVPRAMDDQGQVRSVAAILWEHEHGPKPKRARLVSLCGVRPCVRPDHHAMRQVPLSAASAA